MKKISILLLLVMLFAACNSSNNNSNNNSAQNVCDCYKKANEINPADAKRSQAQDACIKMEYELRDKLKGDKKKADELDSLLSECATQMLNNDLK